MSPTTTARASKARCVRFGLSREPLPPQPRLRPGLTTARHPEPTDSPGGSLNQPRVRPESIHARPSHARWLALARPTPDNVRCFVCAPPPRRGAAHERASAITERASAITELVANLYWANRPWVAGVLSRDVLGIGRKGLSRSGAGGTPPNGTPPPCNFPRRRVLSQTLEPAAPYRGDHPGRSTCVLWYSRNSLC